MAGVMGYAVEHPLADLRIDSYQWPDPDDPRLVVPIHEKAGQADRSNKFPCGSHRETLWERAYNLVGMDRLMLAFYDQPGAVRDLLHRIMDFQLGIARHYAAAGIELAATGDDLGGQSGLLFSRELLEEFFVPEYRRLFGFYKTRGVIINHHTCGHIEPVLDVFMDLGVDILNPIQATANNLAVVRKATQGRMALAGGISTGMVMDGPVERIRIETRRCMWLLGREGGYFCGPDQGMPFPEAHIAALRQTVEEYGTYPLKPPE
jgi:uroporphyrinogen decarboxylase